jgi:hypothetical protein
MLSPSKGGGSDMRGVSKAVIETPLDSRGRGLEKMDLSPPGLGYHILAARDLFQ